MQHFIQYHNPKRMGYPLPDGVHQRVLTNKPVNHLLGNTVWLVTFEGQREYSLGSVFQVTEVGDANEEGFKHFASGKGHAFHPWPRIKDMDWFPKILRVTGNFGLGLQEVKDVAVIAGLTKIAEQAGYKVG
jgi:hypothetical protein